MSARTGVEKKEVKAWERGLRDTLQAKATVGWFPLIVLHLHPVRRVLTVDGQQAHVDREQDQGHRTTVQKMILG